MLWAWCMGHTHTHNTHARARATRAAPPTAAQVSSELKNAVNSRALTALGELEQDLVCGDRDGQDLVKFFAGEGLT